MSEVDAYLDARAVKRRYGNRSDSSLWRWIRDPNLGFPSPIYVRQVRYWRLADLIGWEQSRPREPIKTNH